MNAAHFRVVALDSQHDRAQFESGVSELDHYFRHQVTQDIRRRVTACFVALTQDTQVAGFYTLAATSVLLADLPAPLRKKLPRYPSVPAVRLGRLAVAKTLQGQGLGGVLLADALARTVRAEIAAYALLVDAKDQTAATFYQHHGFIPLPDQTLTLFFPLARVAQG